MSLSQLPEQMIEAISMLPKHLPVVLITRHSLREVVQGRGLAGYDLQLTSDGIVLAQAWGEYLATQGIVIKTITTSPIQRCVDTSHHMLVGTGQNPSAGLKHACSALFVEPGSFVVDIEQASPSFKAYGALGFINAFLAGRVAGMKTVRQGVCDILTKVYQLTQQGHGLHLVVTHDTILAVIYAYLAKVNVLDQAEWPHMMEGMFVWFEGQDFLKSEMVWLWRGQISRISTQEIFHTI
ncbi:histidine phosphatase family protein [Acinetobacter sp. B5B]|uniref:histidine phosphatase family protein n=1 Tax=Acinetobacter baretiae TaxID=2605383 RepID=UPI0018C2C3C5|nr:histidine phosphatase family protein [Acinetobacter baretiae]MBF7682475.1 histidine phosphatase family protein [Acinetobacter baretiae]